MKEGDGMATAQRFSFSYLNVDFLIPTINYIIHSIITKKRENSDFNMVKESGVGQVWQVVLCLLQIEYLRKRNAMNSWQNIACCQTSLPIPDR